MKLTFTLLLLASAAGLTLSSCTHSQLSAVKPAGTDVVYKVTPGFDQTSIDPSANPCGDFYKYACGKFAANHPIPLDQSEVDAFYQLYNVNVQALRGLIEKAAAGGASRSVGDQKIGDFYQSCMDTDHIDQKGLAPIQPILDEINALKDKKHLTPVVGRLQRVNVNAFFGYGEQQDFKDATQQIASVSQGGLGMPEKDYYLRTDAKSVETRNAYVVHVAKMFELSGESAEHAKQDAVAILEFETGLAKASMGVTEMRDPAKVYHIKTVAALGKTIPLIQWRRFETEMHSPHVTKLNVVSPDFFPALNRLIQKTDLAVLKVYLRHQVLSSFASSLPKPFDAENFHFYGTVLSGTPQQAPRWKRCSNATDSALGEVLGQAYVEHYFAGDSKQKTVQMVDDIERAMDRDLDQLDWMQPETRVRAKEKLHAVANKIGYPDKWRDYSKLTVQAGDAIGNSMRARGFENDRQLAKIGKPVNRAEWDMTPPTVNAYYDPSMNNINFPAGILQPAFYDKSEDDATNYGHIGAIIGHELTHGFDDQGAQFDGKGNLSNWWTSEDKKKFETRTGCLVNEYDGFVAIDDLKINGRLTLGENTADNGGLVLAYMAYVARAKIEGVNLAAKVHGYTAPQRFYIGFAQNYCENSRPEGIRTQVQTDPHSPDHFRVNGVIVNQPGFAEAFGCSKGSPMAPANNCRIW